MSHWVSPELFTLAPAEPPLRAEPSGLFHAAGHAPGWTWRRDTAGRVDRPWAWSQINGGQDLPARVSGLCEAAWHRDCPQAPLTRALPGCCSCPCHQTNTLTAYQPAGGAL